MKFGLRTSIFAIVPAVGSLLAGCEPGPAAFYLQEGTTGGGTQSDLTQCEVEAVNAVPAAIVQTVSPVYRTSGTTDCRETVLGIQCTTRPGTTYGGNISNSDQNVGLRSRVLNQCMASKGYDFVTLPHCTGEQIAAGRFYPDATPKPKASSLNCWSSTGGFVDLS